VDQYIEAFQPDVKLLFVRHPEHNLASLKKKFYAGVAGSVDEKFKALEDAYRRRDSLFDEVGSVSYHIRVVQSLPPKTRVV